MLIMNIRLLAIVVVILAFGALTAKALLAVGFWGIIEPHFQSWGAAQVFVDLVIMGLITCTFVVTDARRRGVAAWPWVLFTLAAGSFGPLVYLAVREWQGDRRG